jgi:formylglycine-generating enzyme required for sulfatase activity
MKNWKQRFFSAWAFAVIFVAGFIVTGCKTGNEGTKDVAVTKVTLNETSLDLEVNKTATLTAAVVPKNATDKTVTWKSSDDTKATVTVDAATGVATVTAKAVGTGIIITATAKNGKKATCAVTVTAAGTVSGVTLAPTTLELYAGGGSKQLTPTVESENAGPHNVTWKSSDETKATVTGDGIVSGVAAGTATITVTTVEKKADGQPATATCAVTVKAGMLENMVLIEAGPFQMGSPIDEVRNQNEAQHNVTLTKDFYMGAYTVTQKEYLEVTGDRPSYFNWQNKNPYGSKWEQFPVDSITWYDAVEYCNKLSEREGLTSVYTITGRTPASGYPITEAAVTANWNNDGYRLPTEAEWEYACRAGTTGPFNFYDEETGKWGTAYSITTDQANYDGGEDPYDMSDTHWLGYPMFAGFFSPNEWGLYAMHGDMAEWCWDWYKFDYGTAAQEDPKGPDTADPQYPFRILRGGAYDEPAWRIRSAFRNANPPSDRCFGDFLEIPVIGFRIVRNAPPGSI